jgi:4-amino-4-deoxy-L-arabinose transferase-like glycosyltransferase
MTFHKLQRHHFLVLILLGSFVLLSGLYSTITPLWEAPDEIGHFAYIQHLLESGRLPEQQPGVVNHAHHPPLYYLIASRFAALADLDDPTGAFRPNPKFGWTSEDEANISRHHTDETFPYHGLSLAAHLARATSILMGTMTILLIVILGWQIFPEHRQVGLLAGALVAFNPQFLFITSAINNDALLALATTGILWQTIRMREKTDRPGQWLLLGLWIAVALLTKLSSIALVVVVGAFLLFDAWRRRNWRPLVRGALVAGSVVVLLTGWWFVRNQLLYGDPLGWRLFAQIDAANFRTGPLTLTDFTRFLNTQFRSFWGVFGWMNVIPADWFYLLAALLVLTGLAGLVLLVVRGKWHRMHHNQRLDLALLAAAILAQQLYLFRAINTFNASWYQGRYLFPVVGPISVLLALGLSTLVSPLQRSIRSILLGGLVLAMAAVALLMPLTVIGPAYETPFQPKFSLWLLPNRPDVTYGDQILLKGYRVESDGSSLTLTLVWQAQKRPDFDYSAFVHLIDGTGQLRSQNDGAPGAAGGYLPQTWLPEDIIHDRRVLALPDDAIPPLTLHVGLYNWSDGQRLPAVSATDPLDQNALVIPIAPQE